MNPHLVLQFSTQAQSPTVPRRLRSADADCSRDGAIYNALTRLSGPYVSLGDRSSLGRDASPVHDQRAILPRGVLQQRDVTRSQGTN